MRWLNALLGRGEPGALPTTDFYFLGALGDLVRPAGSGDPGRPIERLGPFTFAHADRALIVRYATDRELALLVGRRLRQVYYIVDDMLPIAPDLPELPADYRARLGRFVREVLPRVLALDPVVVAPRQEILELFPGRRGELLDPCWLSLPPDLTHFDRLAEHGVLEVAFLGTRSHQEGLAFLCEALPAALAMHPRMRVTLFQGHHLPRPLTGLAAIDNRRPLPWPAFRALLARRRFHAVLAPLPDSPFNRGRSITKLMDVAAVGAAGLYADRVPFRTAVTHGHDGLLLPDDPRRWAKALAGLAADSRSASRLAAGALKLAALRGDHRRLRRFWAERLGLANARSSEADRGPTA